jgi:hypothetical protein
MGRRSMTEKTATSRWSVSAAKRLFEVMELYDIDCPLL